MLADTLSAPVARPNVSSSQLQKAGAKMFKKGNYPLHPSIRSVVDTETGSFSSRDAAGQTEATRVMLRATLSRLISVGLPSVMEN
jgi:hypothetical protein